MYICTYTYIYIFYIMYVYMYICIYATYILYIYIYLILYRSVFPGYLALKPVYKCSIAMFNCWVWSVICQPVGFGVPCGDVPCFQTNQEKPFISFMPWCNTHNANNMRVYNYLSISLLCNYHKPPQQNHNLTTTI